MPESKTVAQKLRESLSFQQEKKADPLYLAVKNFLDQPNWQNRIGPWKDIHEALHELERVFKQVS